MLAMLSEIIGIILELGKFPLHKTILLENKFNVLVSYRFEEWDLLALVLVFSGLFMEYEFLVLVRIVAVF